MAPVLSKPLLEVGMVFWLEDESSCRARDSQATARCGLAPRAFSHPVMIIDLLGDDSHPYVWVSVMTSTWNPNHKTLPILYHYFCNGRLFLSECAGCRSKHADGKTDEMLFHVVDEARMNQHGHVSAEKVYEVSVDMLRQERKEKFIGLGHYQIDYRSTQVLREKLGKAMTELSKTSYALKHWPRPAPPNFDDLPQPVSDHDPIAGTYDGMTPFTPDAVTSLDLSIASRISRASTPDSFITASSTQSSTITTSSSNSSDSSEDGASLSILGEESKLISSERTASQPRSGEQDSVAVTSTSSAPSSSGPVHQISPASSPCMVVAPQAPAPDPTPAMARTSQSVDQVLVRPLPAKRPSRSFKPGDIKWYGPNAPEYNQERYRYLSKPNNRPCIVVDHNKSTGGVLFALMTTFAGKPEPEVLKADPTPDYSRWFPIVRPDIPASKTPRSLSTVNSRVTKRKLISFVDACGLLEAPAGKLRDPTEGPDRLTEDSLVRLLAQIKLEAQKVATSADAEIIFILGYNSIRLARLKTPSRSTVLSLRVRAAAKSSDSAPAATPNTSTDAAAITGKSPTPAAPAPRAPAASKHEPPAPSKETSTTIDIFHGANKPKITNTVDKHESESDTDTDNESAAGCGCKLGITSLGKDILEKARTELAKIGG